VSSAADRNLATPAVCDSEHLVERMRNRNINLDGLNKLRLWIESKPTVPEGNWYKDFGSFKLCGEGKYPKTFLLPGQLAVGEEL
jgi:hypothetical protein